MGGIITQEIGRQPRFQMKQVFSKG
jgi:hypothetical protein